MWWAKTKNKYRNEKIQTDDGTFDSRLEYKEWLDLKLLMRAGKISSLKRQVKIKLGKSQKCKVSYIADFVYFDNDKNVWIIHDTKGYETTEFKIKLKWLLDMYVGFIFKLSFRNKMELLAPYNNDGVDIKGVIC